MDPNELEMFQNLAEDWYKYGEPLCAMNGLRVPCIVERLEFLGVLKKEYIGTEQPLRGLTILDVGCGGGFVSEPLAKLGAEVTGIDGVPELIEVAKKHAALDNTLTKLTYLAESIQDFAKKSIEQYDVVLALEVIDHVCDKQGFTEASIKCLKPGGSIFLSSPNRTFWSWFFYIIVPEYILCLLPRGTHNYDNFISMDDMEKMLESCVHTCRICNTLYTGKANYLKHVQLFHAQSQRRKRKYICKDQAFQQHVGTHADEKISELNMHDNRKIFKCFICDYKCSQTWHLKFHVRTHTGEKLFKCTICDYKCSLAGGVKTHVRTHTGEKLFKCTICDYKL